MEQEGAQVLQDSQKKHVEEDVCPLGVSLTRVFNLQTLTFPDETQAATFSLFVRWRAGAGRIADAHGHLVIEPGEELDLFSYFNAFSRWKWRNLTDIDRVGVSLEGRGRVRVRLLGFDGHGIAVQIWGGECTLGGEAIPVQDLADHKHLLSLGLIVEALDERAVLTGGAWVTDLEPRRDVSIAAVITTFRRENAVRTAMDRLRKAITARDNSGVDHLYVIDNGGTLDPASDPHLTIIPNPNLGGAGGFTRGLLEARDAGRYTHVLFMDDDAACLPESVWRTASLLRYAREPSLAVAGSMLLEERPTLQYERSAVFHLKGRRHHSVWSARGHMWDLTDSRTLIHNDWDADGNYGAWWYFCFPLSAVKHLPFPFFVRGDDIDFSLVNKFPIATMNGIATWCSDLAKKVVTPVDYLESRSWLTLALMHGDMEVARCGMRRLFNDALNAGRFLNYGRMEAITVALADVAQGPEFFGSHPSAMERLDEVRRLSNSRPVSSEDLDCFLPAGRMSRWLRWRAKWTAWGHRLADRKMKNKIVYRGRIWELYGVELSRRRFTALGEGENAVVYERDSNRFLNSQRRLIQLRKQMKRDFPQLLERFRRDHALYRTEDYWRVQLKMPNVMPDGVAASSNADHEKSQSERV